jgi:hypothetical protein
MEKREETLHLAVLQVSQAAAVENLILMRKLPRQMAALVVVERATLLPAVVT